MKKIAIIIVTMLILSGCGRPSPTAPIQQTIQPASTTTTTTASATTTVIFVNHAPVL